MTTRKFAALTAVGLAGALSVVPLSAQAAAPAAEAWRVFETPAAAPAAEAWRVFRAPAAEAWRVFEAPAAAPAAEAWRVFEVPAAAPAAEAWRVFLATDVDEGLAQVSGVAFTGVFDVVRTMLAR